MLLAVIRGPLGARRCLYHRSSQRHRSPCRTSLPATPPCPFVPSSRTPAHFSHPPAFIQSLHPLSRRAFTTHPSLSVRVHGGRAFVAISVAFYRLLFIPCEKAAGLATCRHMYFAFHLTFAPTPAPVRLSGLCPPLSHLISRNQDPSPFLPKRVSIHQPCHMGSYCLSNPPNQPYPSCVSSPRNPINRMGLRFSQEFVSALALRELFLLFIFLSPCCF
jgi:hypothetical protein